jgi:ParB/RepB/Spo0J family partition protein
MSTLPIAYSETIIEVEPKNLYPNPNNPRTSGPGDVTELAKSIEEVGLLEPLLVRAYPMKGPGRYIIDAGERRWTAGKYLGVTLACRVGSLAEGVNPVEHSLITGLTENGRRTGLNAIERAKAYQRLIKEFGLTQAALARRLGLTTGTVSRTMNVLVLSEKTQQAVAEGKLTLAQANALVTQHREKQRKKAGQQSQIPDYEPPVFTANHFLAVAAKRLCDSSEHEGLRVLVRGIACERHWEAVIRRDEAKVQQKAAQDSGFNVPFVSPVMAAVGNQLGNGGGSGR